LRARIEKFKSVATMDGQGPKPADLPGSLRPVRSRGQLAEPRLPGEPGHPGPAGVRFRPDDLAAKSSAHNPRSQLSVARIPTDERPAGDRCRTRPHDATLHSGRPRGVAVRTRRGDVAPRPRCR